jgi:hypothetical protein
MAVVRCLKTVPYQAPTIFEDFMPYPALHYPKLIDANEFPSSFSLVFDITIRIQNLGN